MLDLHHCAFLKAIYVCLDQPAMPPTLLPAAHTQTEKCPMVVMEAVMVQLPFPAEVGSEGLLHKLGESNLPVKAFGSDTVQAIIMFKWRKFSQRAILIKTIIYMAYLFVFTAYACLLSDDLGPPQVCVHLCGCVCVCVHGCIFVGACGCLYACV